MPNLISYSDMLLDEWIRAMRSLGSIWTKRSMEKVSHGQRRVDPLTTCVTLGAALNIWGKRPRFWGS